LEFSSRLRGCRRRFTRFADRSTQQDQPDPDHGRSQQSIVTFGRSMASDMHLPRALGHSADHSHSIGIFFQVLSKGLPKCTDMRSIGVFGKEEWLCLIGGSDSIWIWTKAIPSTAKTLYSCLPIFQERPARHPNARRLFRFRDGIYRQRLAPCLEDSAWDYCEWPPDRLLQSPV
jgi:hypothetical protein